MSRFQHDDTLNRLEYFIQLGKRGKQVGVEVTLRKEFVEQQVHPDATDDGKEKTHMYLLFGDYRCECEGDSSIISKIYVYGTTGESVSASRVTKGAANARLKMDYQRLKDANVKFEEKYF